MTTRLAAVIPTRNRGTLALNAVRSLLDQDCEIEIFVSDHSDSPRMEGDLHSFGKTVHALRPDRPLSVADHWDWAIREAMALSEATHFMIHHDRRVALPRSWGAIARAAHAHPDVLITAGVDAISDVPPPLRLWQAPWTGNLFSIATGRAAQVIAQGRISQSVHALPLLNNSFVPRAVLQEVIERFGDVCRGIGPDTAFMARFLTLRDRYLFADRPLGILYAPQRSSNLGSARNSGEDFAEYVRLHGQRPWLHAAPVPGVNIGSNMLFHEYETVRQATGDALPPLDRAAVLCELANGLQWIVDRGQRKAAQAVLRNHGWRGRAPVWRQLVRPRLVQFAARLGIVHSFADDETALRYALAHPRARQETHEHLTVFEPQEIAD